MPRHSWLWALLALWAALYASSFVLSYLTEPTGDSFTRGFNRLSLFLQLQGAACVLAVILWIQGRTVRRGTSLRRLTRLPGILALLLVLALIGIIASAVLTEKSPEPASTVPTKPVTQTN